MWLQESSWLPPSRTLPRFPPFSCSHQAFQLSFTMTHMLTQERMASCCPYLTPTLLPTSSHPLYFHGTGGQSKPGPGWGKHPTPTLSLTVFPTCYHLIASLQRALEFLPSENDSQIKCPYVKELFNGFRFKPNSSFSFSQMKNLSWTAALSSYHSINLGIQ